MGGGESWSLGDGFEVEREFDNSAIGYQTSEKVFEVYLNTCA